MNGWRWGFLLLVYAALVLKTGAVEHGRTQPTERISGGISFIFISVDSFFLNSISFFFDSPILFYFGFIC